MNKELKETTYYVSGMHCASCELIIEKGVLKGKGVEVVEASKSRSEVKIGYRDKKPSLKKLNKMFAGQNYKFSLKKEGKETGKKDWRRTGLVVIVSMGIIGGFLLLNRYGISAMAGVGSKTAMLGFILFGLMAGVSSCAALVGGMVLSLTKQWGCGTKPQILFNGGRLLAYAVAGLILGTVGKAMGISLTFSSILVFGVALLMLIMGLQMLGIKMAQKVTISLPKGLSKMITGDSWAKKDYVPAIIGALTVFLPCGFTITTAGLAVTSGDPVTGMLMMLMFALGTVPMLLAIGLSSMKILEKPHWSDTFLKIAGIVVLFLAAFNINAQLIVLDWGGISLQTRAETDEGLTTIINGKQVIKMKALAYGYEPNYIKIKAGVPVRWEIEDKGTSGCTNAVISRGLFDGEIRLTPGQTSVKEFTVQEPGVYGFSCWMGMVSGTIEVVGDSGETVNNLIDSGTQSCDGSCGGSCGSTSCGCGGGI